MLAVPGEPFDSPQHTFEVKWDGVRALAYKDGDRFWITTRNLKPALARFPELSDLPAALAAARVVIDGEIIVFGADGRPDFDRVCARSAARSPAAIARSARSFPATYIAFDCLWRDGEDLMPLPLKERRRHLREVILPSPHLAAPEGVEGQGRAFFAATAAEGLEGMVAKDLTSPYQPGKRSPSWVKVRNVKSADCVIGGFVPRGEHFLKSVLLGLYDAGRLLYVGHVGSGFSQDENRELRALLGAIPAARPPFAAIPPACARGAVWTQPHLVCTVEYLTLTSQGHLRHPVYRGIRSDKDPKQCHYEIELASSLLPAVQKLHR